MSSGGVGPDGKVYCKHMEEAAKRKSNTSKHPDREFYCCKRLQSDQSKCNFWSWADQVPRLKDSSVHASRPALAAQSSTPRSSKEGGTRARPIATPPRPVQKYFSPSETPKSIKRLGDIEVGLRQREQDLTPPRHLNPSKESGLSMSLLGLETVPQPPSPVPTEVDCEVETQPRKSFLGLEHSPELVPTTIKAEDQPSNSKKRRLTPPSKETAIQPDAISLGGGLPLTPPQTTQRAAQSDGLGPVSDITHRSKKGKERAWDQDGCAVEPQEEDSLPLFTLPEDTTSTSSASPTTAENVLDFADGMKARVKTLSEYMDSFDISQAARMLQTIERQRNQYECRDRSQKMRIEALVAERDELSAEVSRLKEALRRSEESGGYRGHEFELIR